MLRLYHKGNAFFWDNRLRLQKAFVPIVQFFGVTVGLEKILAWNN